MEKCSPDGVHADSSGRYPEGIQTALDGIRTAPDGNWMAPDGSRPFRTAISTTHQT